MEGTLNCSKGCRVQGTDNEWLTYKEQLLDPGYKVWLRDQQKDIREHLQKRIDRMREGLE